MSHRAVRVCASAKIALNTTSVLRSSPSVFFIGPIGGQDPWLVGTHGRGRLAPNVTRITIYGTYGIYGILVQMLYVSRHCYVHNIGLIE